MPAAKRLPLLSDSGRKISIRCIEPDEDQVILSSGSSGFGSPGSPASASPLRCCALPSSRNLPSPMISATASLLLPVIVSVVLFSVAISSSRLCRLFPVLVHILRHFEVVLQRRQCLAGPV